jgi:hypothetical protein
VVGAAGAAADRWTPAWGERCRVGALQRPESPEELLAGHAADLDGAWRAVSGGIVPDGPVCGAGGGQRPTTAPAASSDPKARFDVVRMHRWSG